MNKLIIENRSELTDKQCLHLVERVIESGRISNNNKQYCYLTRLKYINNWYSVSTDLNEKSDRFVITNGEH